MLRCPDCEESKQVKSGFTLGGKQRYLCVCCGRRYVENPLKVPVSEEKKEIIDRLLLERIPLAGISRALEVSESWLQNYVNKKYEEVPDAIEEPPEPSEADLTIECDEAWSFVQNKGDKQWIWLAMDRRSRKIVGFYVGDRSAEGAQKLWDSLPQSYKENARCFTDFWEAYAKAFPKDRHVASGKEEGNANHIERFNGTMRARISRLVRLSYSFSKKFQNHVAAIAYFIRHYNLALSPQ